MRKERKVGTSPYNIILEMWILHDLTANLSASQIILTGCIPEVVCAFLRAM